MADTQTTFWTPWPDLAEMLARAKAEGLMFYTCYQGMWFKPEDLERYWEQGRFRWGACNWRLRPASEYLAESEREAKEAAERHERVKAYVGQPQPEKETQT